MLQEFIQICENILGSVREPLLVLNAELEVVQANKPFYVAFDLQANETEGLSIYQIGNGTWNIPELKVLLEKILPKNSFMNDFAVEHDFPKVGRKQLHLNARRIYDESRQAHLILLAIEDVTLRENLSRNLEDLVKARTFEVTEAKEHAEQERMVAEAALTEIRNLRKQLEAERAYLQDEIRLDNNHESIIGHSDVLNSVLVKVQQIAKGDTTVLVLGETGTGKELVARAVHAMSLRKDRPLVKMNCAALPSNLIESELFGHEKGAFTGADCKRLGRFEIAHRSTLFLDEIGELPLELQPKLLRVIQEGEFERLGSSQTLKVDVRLIAATNRDLAQEVSNERFRSDLWYRLNVFPITMPPLRDRAEDIPELVEFYVKKICKRMGKNIEVIPTHVMESLQNYQWPGNVRELENVLERGVINSSGPKLRLMDEIKSLPKSPTLTYQKMESVERDHILKVLQQTHWQVSGVNGASEILGLHRSTLRARMRKLGIQKPRFS